MEELIALLAGNLEADETEAFSRDNGLMTLGTENAFTDFHARLPRFFALTCKTPGLGASSDVDPFFC